MEKDIKIKTFAYNFVNNIIHPVIMLLGVHENHTKRLSLSKLIIEMHFA